MIWVYIYVRLSTFSVGMLFKNELSFLRCKMSKKKVIYWLWCLFCFIVSVIILFVHILAAQNVGRGWYVYK